MHAGILVYSLLPVAPVPGAILSHKCTANICWMSERPGQTTLGPGLCGSWLGPWAWILATQRAAGSSPDLTSPTWEQAPVAGPESQDPWSCAHGAVLITTCAVPLQDGAQRRIHLPATAKSPSTTASVCTVPGHRSAVARSGQIVHLAF